MTFFGITQHAGLRVDVLDHRLNTRTVYMNPVLRFLYLNMNYHLEHHLFPSVPYHALPALHDDIKHDLPLPNRSVLDAYREIVSALRQQRRDPSWEIPDRWTPPVVTRDAPVQPAARDDIDVHDLGAADELQPGQVRRIDIGDATYLLCRPAPDLYALTDGLCTHGHALLADGHLDGYVIECPKHNGRFDVRTGEPVRRPVKIPLTTHRVDVVDGRLVADVSPPSAR
jgi:nitrite reductase/ring-hydroxylating ferredoxin subunit